MEGSYQLLALLPGLLASSARSPYPGKVQSLWVLGTTLKGPSSRAPCGFGPGLCWDSITFHFPSLSDLTSFTVPIHGNPTKPPTPKSLIWSDSLDVCQTKIWSYTVWCIPALGLTLPVWAPAWLQWASICKLLTSQVFEKYTLIYNHPSQSVAVVLEGLCHRLWQNELFSNLWYIYWTVFTQPYGEFHFGAFDFLSCQQTLDQTMRTTVVESPG